MLKPPLNVHTIEPKCCAFCKYLGVDDSDAGYAACKRDPEGEYVQFDAGTIYTTLCDRFVHS